MLKHYLIKSTQLNKIVKYVIYKTVDNHLTLFEKLSMNNQIGIITNLSDFDSKIILILFQSLYSKNYSYFMKDFMQDVLYDNDIQNNDFGLDDLLNQLDNKIINLNKWIEYLNLIPTIVNNEFENNNELNELNDYIDEYCTNICDQQIYKHKPTISKYYNLNHRQKFYTLNEIYNL